MPGTTTDLQTTDPVFMRLLAKTLISTDFADSGNNTFAETQALLPLAGIDILLDVHLTRFKEITKTLKFSDIAAANTGGGKKGTTDGAFVQVTAATDTEAMDVFNYVAIVAAAKKSFNTSASINDTAYLDSEKANDTLADYLAQPVSPGVGPTWYKALLAFGVGNMPFKLKITDNGSGKRTITELQSTETNYEASVFYQFPSNPIKNDFTAAGAVRRNNGNNLMKPTDMPSGTIKAAAAVYLVTGIDTSGGDKDLTGINTASKVLDIVGLITNAPTGDYLYELNSLTTAAKGINKAAIGDASLTDPRLSAGIIALNNNNSYAYASNSDPKVTRSVDFINDQVYQYSSVVTRLIRWLKIVKKDISALADIYIGSDNNSSALKADLIKGSPDGNADSTATYYANSNLTGADPTKNKIYRSVFKAATDSVSTGTTNLAKFTNPADLAAYISGNGTSDNVTQSPANTTSGSTGINATDGNFNSVISAMVSATKPNISLDLIFDALKLVAMQSNKVRGSFDDVLKIISTWFNANVVPQKPTTTPITTTDMFWDLPPQGEYTEKHAKRLVANYIASNYSLRILSDSRNQAYFDLLFQLGTNSGVGVNSLQAVNLYAYNPILISGNVPVAAKIGTADEVFTLLDKKPDLSTFSKIKLYSEIKFGTVNTTEKIMDLVSVFGKSGIYEISESPLTKDGAEIFVTTTPLNAATSFSEPTNIPDGSTTFYATYTTNNDSHKKLTKRNKVIGRFLDIFAEETNSSIKANKMLDLAKNTTDFNNFVRHHTNFKASTLELFKNIIILWLTNDLAPSIEDIVISSNTYGATVKNAIMAYVGTTLGLASRPLTSATDTITANNANLLTSSISNSVIAAAQLAAKLTKKNPNMDDQGKLDPPIKLKDFAGTASKQDMLLVGLVASNLDGSKDSTKLNASGRTALLEAGVSLSDLALLVIAKNSRSDFWTLSKEVKYYYLAGVDDNGSFVSDA